MTDTSALRRRAIYRNRKSLDMTELYQKQKAVFDQILQIQNSFELQFSELQSTFRIAMENLLNVVDRSFNKDNFNITTNEDDRMPKEPPHAASTEVCCANGGYDISEDTVDLSDDLQNNTYKTFENDPVYDNVHSSSRRLARTVKTPTHEMWIPKKKHNDKSMSEPNSHRSKVFLVQEKSSKNEILKMPGDKQCSSIPNGYKHVGFLTKTISNPSYNKVEIPDLESDRFISVNSISLQLNPDFSDQHSVLDTDNNIYENHSSNRFLTHEESVTIQTISACNEQDIRDDTEPHRYPVCEKRVSHAQSVTGKTCICSRSDTAVKELPTLSDTEIKESQSQIKGQSFWNDSRKPIPSPRRHDQNSTSGYSTINQAHVRSVSARTRVKYVHDAVRRQTFTHVERNMDYDERECLANAFQYHITDLVKGIVFSDSELPDWLINEECVTEDECAAVRNVPDRKDQVRMIVSKIKCRDLRVLNIFLKHIGTHNPCVADKIRERFESNKREGMKVKGCAYCNLKRQVNVKCVADHLWGEMAIEDSLYNEIIDTQRKVGNQNTLWREVIQSINLQDQERRRKAQERLLQALTEKGGLSHHVDGIQQMFVSNHDRLACSCEPKLFLHRMDDMFDATSEESILPDSISDSSSGSRYSTDRTSVANLPCHPHLQC